MGSEQMIWSEEAETETPDDTLDTEDSGPQHRCVSLADIGAQLGRTADEAQATGMVRTALMLRFADGPSSRAQRRAWSIVHLVEAFGPHGTLAPSGNDALVLLALGVRPDAAVSALMTCLEPLLEVAGDDPMMELAAVELPATERRFTLVLSLLGSRLESIPPLVRPEASGFQVEARPAH